MNSGSILIVGLIIVIWAFITYAAYHITHTIINNKKFKEAEDILKCHLELLDKNKTLENHQAFFNMMQKYEKINGYEIICFEYIEAYNKL